MKTKVIASLSGAAVSLALLGCGDGGAWPGDRSGPAQSGTASSALSAHNARGFNARGFNARGFNGRAFNARGFNGISFNGRAFNGNGLGSGFEGVGSSGLTFGGYDLIARRSELFLRSRSSERGRLGFEDLGGSVEMTAHADDPTIDVSVRISGPEPLHGGAVLAYLVEVWDGDEGAWVPGYSDDDGSALLTVPLNGYWNIAPEDLGTEDGGAWEDDRGAITFAAVGYTLAKCVEIGYLPWEYARLHRTCVRAMRADYCGDGRSFTRDGTLIDIFDVRRVLLPETSPPAPDREWEREAEWDEDGARCLSSERVQDWSADEEPSPYCFGEPLSEEYSPECNDLTARGRPDWSDELIRTRHVAPVAE